MFLRHIILELLNRTAQTLKVKVTLAFHFLAVQVLDTSLGNVSTQFEG